MLYLNAYQTCGSNANNLPSNKYKKYIKVSIAHYINIIYNDQVTYIHVLVFNCTAQLFSVWRETFSMFDKNADGHICTNELGTVMRAMGQNPTNANVEAMMSKLDADGEYTHAQQK